MHDGFEEGLINLYRQWDCKTNLTGTDLQIIYWEGTGAGCADKFLKWQTIRCYSSVDRQDNPDKLVSWSSAYVNITK